MTPSPAPCYISDDMFCRSGSVGYLGDIEMLHVQAHDFASNIFRQGLVVGLFAFRHFTSVSAGVIGWRRRVPAPFYGILRIMLQRSPSQVVWVAARRIVARVERVVPFKGGLSVGEIAGNARGYELFPSGFFVGDREATIAVAIHSCRKPRPTIVWASHFDFRPKPSNVFFAQVKHVRSIMFVPRFYSAL